MTDHWGQIRTWWHSKLQQQGPQWLYVTGTLYFWGVGAHALYLTLVPAPLKDTVAARSAPAARRAALLVVGAVGAYDLLQQSRLSRQEEAVQQEYQTLVGTQL